MTQAYFSPSLSSFIPAEWKDDGTYDSTTWPSDAILATEDELGQYWKQSPPEGKLLGSIDGRPAWVDQPPLTHEQLVSLASGKKTALMQSASEKLSILQDAVDLEIATEDESASLIVWKKYRVLLNRVDPSAAPDIQWPVSPV